MKSQRDNLERILSKGFVVSLHVIEESTFIRQVKVVLKLGIDFVVVGQVSSRLGILILMMMELRVQGYLLVLALFNLLHTFLDTLDWLEYMKVSVLLPLSPNEIMFSKIFLVQIQVCSIFRWQKYVPIYSNRQGLVYVPPPSVILEQLDNQLRVITLAYKPFIELELTPLKIEFNLVLLINDLEEFLKHDLLALENKSLLLEQLIVQDLVLRDVYAQSSR